MDMYTNNIIVSFCGLVGYFFAGAVIRAIGAKRLLSKQKPFLFVVSSLYYLLVPPAPHSLWSVHICCTGLRALLVHQRSDDNYHIFGLYHCGRSCCLLPAGRCCRSVSHTIAVNADDSLHKKIYWNIMYKFSQLFGGCYCHDVRTLGCPLGQSALSGLRWDRLRAALRDGCLDDAA